MGLVSGRREIQLEDGASYVLWSSKRETESEKLTEVCMNDGVS